MILYHFCSARHFASIQRWGISKGRLPWRLDHNLNPVFKQGFQWLTKDPDWVQGWDLPAISKLPYRRTEYRIALDIPNFGLNRLMSWQAFEAKHHPQSAEFINAFPDSRYWYLFAGSMPTAWFVATARNPIPIDLPEFNEN